MGDSLTFTTKQSFQIRIDVFVFLNRALAEWELQSWIKTN